MARLLKEPFVHFLALGALLFAVSAWSSRAEIEAREPDSVEVTEAVIDRLRAGHERQFQQAPDAEELRALVAAFVREEVLFREALKLGLDQNDTIVRRRLAQKMEFLTDDLGGARLPEDDELREYFAHNRAAYERPARVSFRHVYFSSSRRGDQVDADARAALRALQQAALQQAALQQGALQQGASDEELGDGFLLGFEFDRRDAVEIEAMFGGEFARALLAIPAGAWAGPLASSYGLHVVRVDLREEPRAVEFAEVRDSVERDFAEHRRRADNSEVYERLKQRYRVLVDESALLGASGPSR